MVFIFIGKPSKKMQFNFDEMNYLEIIFEKFYDGQLYNWNWLKFGFIEFYDD